MRSAAPVTSTLAALPPQGPAHAASLLYIADLIQELRLLAERTGSETLSQLLDVAHREAMLRAHDSRA